MYMILNFAENTAPSPTILIIAEVFYLTYRPLAHPIDVLGLIRSRDINQSYSCGVDDHVPGMHLLL